MKITQEMRDFARLQEEKTALSDADQGMAEMSDKFRAVGSELYVETVDHG
jgi:hypothetical protein